MILGDEVFTVLKNESELSERSISSHWIEHLKDFNYVNGEFSVKGLEGRGGGRKSKLNRSVEYIFQTPFRRQGKQFSEFKKILQCANKVHKERDTTLQQGSLRQVLSLAFIQKFIDLNQLAEPIVVIGDGFGVMSSLLLYYLSDSKAKVVAVNLTQNLLIDAVFIKKSVPSANICLVKNSETYHEALKDSGVNVICIQADNAHLISSAAIGLAINIASMQEMNPSIVAEYFDFMRISSNQKTYFYCANRIEKTLPDGTIVNFFNFPWHSDDQLIVDELSPWHQYYYNYKRPPFYFPYEGPHQHRLALMYKTPQI
ncbi:putative sugar O-methyltransferase [Deltaproteobacteria bacterium TL4]